MSPLSACLPRASRLLKQMMLRTKLGLALLATALTVPAVASAFHFETLHWTIDVIEHLVTNTEIASDGVLLP